MRDTRIWVDTDSRYPGYGVIEVDSGLYIPVMLGNRPVASVRDCFISGGTSVTAFADEDAAWAFIAQDYASMRHAAQA